jgi:hypothetical protein
MSISQQEYANATATRRNFRKLAASCAAYGMSRNSIAAYRVASIKEKSKEK